MIIDELIEDLKKFLEECLKMLENKNRDYTGGVNAFQNFNKLASDIGLNRKIVWYIYFCKHLEAIRSYITGQYADSEPIEGRIMDAINYLLLFYAMVKEEAAWGNEQ